MTVVCDFCDELSGGTNNAFASTYSPGVACRSVLLTSSFRVFPTLGQIAEGHLLIVPSAHHGALGDLPLDPINELEYVVARVREALAATYGTRCVFFEHGTRGDRAGGCGVYHAHLHAVPMRERQDPIDDLKAAHGLSEISDCRDLKRIDPRRSYLYYEATDLKRYIACVDYLPSQYMRKIVSEAIGRSIWDWRLTGREREFESALARLSAYFGDDGIRRS
jgi:diadenosine tetraphosphate (Ap4A) HIT family hydrolase